MNYPDTSLDDLLYDFNTKDLRDDHKKNDLAALTLIALVLILPTLKLYRDWWNFICKK